MSARKSIRIPLDRVFYRIGDVARLVGVKTHVLRFWESEFSGIAPSKSKSGQRVYRRIDVEQVFLIKHLLYTERFSIEGARRRLRDLKRTGDLPSSLALALQDLPGWVSSWNKIGNQKSRFLGKRVEEATLSEPLPFSASLSFETAEREVTWSDLAHVTFEGREASEVESTFNHARRLLELSERPVAEFFTY